MAAKKIRVIVYHSYYGCETGCCGHTVDFPDDEPAKWFGSQFDFDHPYGECYQKWAREFAQEKVTAAFGADHVADLDWENCVIRED